MRINGRHLRAQIASPLSPVTLFARFSHQFPARSFTKGHILRVLAPARLFERGKTQLLAAPLIGLLALDASLPNGGQIHIRYGPDGRTYRWSGGNRRLFLMFEERAWRFVIGAFGRRHVNQGH